MFFIYIYIYIYIYSFDWQHKTQFKWQHNCFLLKVLKTYRVFLLLFWQMTFWFVAQLIFPFAQYIKHSVYLMLRLIVFDQICYRCQVPLNAQIRVIAEMIKSRNVYINKMQRNNNILLARLLPIAKMSSSLSKIIKVSNIAMH